MFTDPVTAALLPHPTMRTNVLGTPSEGAHIGDVLASLVHADSVVAAHHSILDGAHLENRSTLSQSNCQNLAFDVFILMVILRTT